MDSSFFPQPLRRLPELPLRPSHSVLSWDGSEPALEFHAAPQLPQWTASPGVLLPQQLAVIKPCPDMDGYYPMVRRMTSTFYLYYTQTNLLFCLSLYETCSALLTNCFFPLVTSNPHVPSCSFLNHVTLYHCFFAFGTIPRTTVFVSLFSSCACCYCYCCCFPALRSPLAISLALWVMNRSDLSRMLSCLQTDKLRLQSNAFLLCVSGFEHHG